MLWLGTPFPALMQAPLDVLVERGGIGHAVVLVAGQVAWLAVLVALARAGAAAGVAAAGDPGWLTSPA